MNNERSTQSTLDRTFNGILLIDWDYFILFGCNFEGQI